VKSIPSKHVFSTSGDILTDKRVRLLSYNADNPVLIKENLMKFELRFVFAVNAQCVDMH